MKNYRYLGDEAEILGQRLDAARVCYKQARRKSWAKNYWKQVIECLLFQWRQLPVLKDADAQMTIIPRWTIDYNFYEHGRILEGDGVSDRLYHKFFRESVDIEASWHNNRAARLAKAQY